MKLFSNGKYRHQAGRWLQALALSLPLLAIQVTVSQLATDAGFAAPGVVQAQEKKEEKKRKKGGKKEKKKTKKRKMRY